LNLKCPENSFLAILDRRAAASLDARMLAGLEHISAGDVHFGDVRVMSCRRRSDIAMNENYALSAQDRLRELANPLRLRKLNNAEIDRRVRHAAVSADRQPARSQAHAALGGQKQRTAIGRAIVREPKVFLFDEPLSNLDAKLRAHMRGELKHLQRRLETTTIYVTHDQLEAMSMADSIAVMHEGVLQQFGTPSEIYNHPANEWVAGFVGEPPMNFLNCRLERTNAGCAATYPASVHADRCAAADTDEGSGGEVRFKLPRHHRYRPAPFGARHPGRVFVTEPFGRHDRRGRLGADRRRSRPRSAPPPT
jgi:multiple sugar transport system ATP-binding protein